MRKYTTLFFDLDHTLWDFEKNSAEALGEIFEDLKLSQLGIPSSSQFISNYKIHNHECWEKYRKGEITKDDLRFVRFELALKDFEISNRELAIQIGDEYVRRSPYKTNLFPGALDALAYLQENYKMFIITNGFEEIQHIKLSQSGLDKFFKEIITSEKAGFRKPHPKIFELALQTAGVNHQEVVMIGDDLEADIIGAHEMNLHTILFDPHQNHIEETRFKVINELRELKSIL